MDNHFQFCYVWGHETSGQSTAAGKAANRTTELDRRLQSGLLDSRRELSSTRSLGGFSSRCGLPGGLMPPNIAELEMVIHSLVKDQ